MAIMVTGVTGQFTGKPLSGLSVRGLDNSWTVVFQTGQISKKNHGISLL